MYVEIIQDYRCSSCGDVNCHETVYRERKQIMRCRSCGHEKIVSETKVTTSDNSNYVTYDFTYPNIIEF